MPDTVAVAPPAFLGTFDGSSFVDDDGARLDLGAGRLELRPDKSFLLRFRFAPGFSEGIGPEWMVTGEWAVREQAVAELAAAPVKLDLHVLSSNVQIPGRTLRASVSASEVVVGGGPCIAFWLPRVP